MSSKGEDLRDLVIKEQREKKNESRGGKDGAATKPVVVNREEVCPLLLRVFTSTGGHNNIGEYDRGRTPENEIQIYTWMDATLKELTGLIKEVNPDARRRNTYFNYRVIYPDLRSGRYCHTDLGSTVAGTKGVDDAKTLAECKFTIGDYLDVSISPPNMRGDRMDYGRRGGDRFGGRGGGGGNFRGGDNRRDIDIRDRDFGDNRRGGGGFEGFDRRDGGDERRGDRGNDDRRGGRGNDDRRGRGDRGGGRNRSRSPRDKSV
jgi:histone deacetylase complex subunit SAP18